MRLPGFVNGSYEDQSRVAAGERCINLMPEKIESGGKAPWALYPCPGLRTFATLPTSPGRGIFEEFGRLFTVFGGKLFEIDENGDETDRGDVALDANPVSMSTNGDGGRELFVVSGRRGDILNLDTNVYTTGEVSDVTQGGHLDGFFVGLDAETSTLKISESLDGTTWDPTQIAQRTAAADLWEAVIIVEREIFLFGPKTGEVWYNAGATPFPFAQRRGTEFDTGIAATFSLSKFGATCAWLGKSDGGYGVYQMNGYTPEKISPTGLDWLIGQFAGEDGSGVNDAVGWSYAKEGHSFYVLHFPSVGRTFAYDSTTRKWHERGRWNTQTGAFDVYRGLFHAHAFGKNLVCDPAGDKIYELSSSVYSDIDDGPLRRVRRCPHTTADGRRIFFTNVKLLCDVGVGLQVDADVSGYDPQVILRTSDDGGNRWGNERSRSIGRRGQYDTEVIWDNCGAARDRVWEWSATDPAPMRWFDAIVDLEVGRY